MTSRAYATLAALTMLASLLAIPPQAAAAPTVTTITPTTAPSNGGTVLTIAGSNFQPGALVQFQGSSGDVVSGTAIEATATSIKVTTPPYPAGEVTVTVTNPDGSQFQKGGFSFSASPAPTLSSVSVGTQASASGSTNGGTLATLTGSGFSTTLAPKVTVGEVPAVVLPPLSATRLSVLTGSHPVEATVDVVLENPDGATATLAGAFAYRAATPALALTGLASAGTSNPTVGGTQVTLTGTGFAPGATVSFGTGGAGGHIVTSPAVTYVSATRLDAKSPPFPFELAGQVNVTVTNPNGRTSAAKAFTYTAASAPTVANTLQPPEGAATGRNLVVLSGTLFAPGAKARVFMGSSDTVGTLAETQFVSASQLRVTMPMAPGPQGGNATVKVQNPDGRLSTSAASYRYNPLIAINSVEADAPPLTSAGGAITINGVGFSASGCRVVVGGIAAKVTSCGATQVRATVPPQPAKTADVRIINGATSAMATLQGGLVIAAAPTPTIDTAGPATLSTNGGDLVTIVGTGFQPNATVTIDGIPALRCSTANYASACPPASGTSLAVIAPARTGDSDVPEVTVTVTNPDGLQATKKTPMGYQSGGTANNPFVNSVAAPPNVGTNGGGVMTVSGGNFHTGKNAKPIVTIGGGIPAPDVVVDNQGSLRFTIPPRTATAALTNLQVKVTNPNGDASADTALDDFTYTAGSSAPNITSVSPVTANGGNVTISGSFTPGWGGSVQAGSVSIPFCAHSITTGCATATSSAITVMVPHGTGSVAITVFNPDQKSASKTVTYGASSQPTYAATNKITPTAGVQGTLVTLRGSNFAPGDGTLKVKVNGSSDDVIVTSATTTEVAFLLPPRLPGPATVELVNPDGKSSATTITYRGTASGVIVSPATGTVNGGKPVTLTGRGFEANLPLPVVYFGDLPALASSITTTKVVVAPPAVPATETVARAVNVVDRYGQTLTIPAAFKYDAVAIPPSFTAISPAASSVNGGTQVTVTGNGFVPGAEVCLDLCLAPLPGVEVVNDRTIRFFAPMHPPGPVDILIKNPTALACTGSTAEKAACQRPNTLVIPADRSLFSYLPVAGPTVASVTPNTGDVAGGTAVTIAGDNFATGATVTFNGTAATDVVVASATSLTAKAPAAAKAGPVTVTVTVGGIPASLPNGFTYTKVNTTTTTTATNTTTRTTTTTTTSRTTTTASPPLNLTAAQILAANQEVKVTVTRDGDDNVVNFTLPASPPATPAGAQVFRSNSPYVLVSTLSAGTPGFAARSYRDVGAPLDSTYKVTLFYAGGVGKATTGPTDIPGFDQVAGVQSDAAQKDFIFKLALGIGIGLAVLLLVLLGLLLVRRRRRDAQAALAGGDTGYIAPPPEEAPQAPSPEAEPQGPTHTVNCPICKSTFEAVGEKPLRMRCPNCGREGILR